MLTAELRQRIRLRRDALARAALDERHVEFCDGCGKSFDTTRKSTTCGSCRTPTTSQAEEKRRQRKRETQRSYRHSAAGRASHARSQARWRHKVR